MTNKSVFAVNIEHPMYKKYIQQYERYGFGESVDLDIRTLFHLLPDTIKEFTLTELGKEDLLVDQFLYLDEFTYLYYEPPTGQFTMQYSPLIEPDRQNQKVLVLEDDCLFTVPCPHPLHINTFDPAFSDWIELHEPHTEKRTVVHIPEQNVLNVLPDIVQGTILTDNMKRDLLMKGELALGNGNMLQMDYGSQSLFILARNSNNDRVEYAQRRAVNQFECKFYYEESRSQALHLVQHNPLGTASSDRNLNLHL